LNTAFLDDGAYIHIRRGTVIHEPICFLYVSTSNESPLMSQSAQLIAAENETQATIVEDYVSISPTT